MRKKSPIKSGYLIATEFSATGGVEYETKRLRAEGSETEIRVVRTADNPELLKDSKAIVGAAHYFLERTCVNIPFGGFYADDAQLSEVKSAISDFKKAARDFNELAARYGSDRRVSIDVYVFPLTVDNDHVIARLARFVVDRLTLIRDALRVGDRKEFESVYDKSRNIDRLADGIRANAVKLALDVAKARKRELIDSVRAGADAKSAGSKLDLSALDSAINLFIDAIDKEP